MNLGEIEENVKRVVSDENYETFIFRLLAAYGKPKVSITRLQKGNLNLSKKPNEVIWKKNVFFHRIDSVVQGSHREDIHVIADRLRRSEDVTKHDLRFVIVTDFETFLAVDTKFGETLDIKFAQLAKHSHFFLPWTGQEKHKTHNESQADIKAAYRMGKLYDEICKENPELAGVDNHLLNVFLARLLFCFFAEDTEIFPIEGMFTNGIASHTQDDASDLSNYLDRLFEILNIEKRTELPAYLEGFPYVNGGLFSEKLAVPKFSRAARKIILECGDLDWSEINPDIFGSMMQAVVKSEDRGSMHYTSVSNIMKTISPLFLDDLRASFEDSFENQKSLEKLRTRLSNIRVFDPACGSGNFLIIAFKELRKLEMEIFSRLRELDPNYQTMFTMPQIKLTQFCGIEIGDFAHEIAILSLWLAEHQMNVKFKQTLGILVPPLPLKPSGNIVCGNATDVDWDNVCPAQNDEIFVIGNPPYCGARKQDEQQKLDMKRVFEGREEYKDSDYVACWFLKGADYIRSRNASLAFVATSSVCQGEQVAYIWPHIFQQNLEIGFAFQSFLWTNNAKDNAGVTCVVVGLRNNANKPKFLHSLDSFKQVNNISPYLHDGKTVVVYPVDEPISGLPAMVIGNMARDGGNLILTPAEKKSLLDEAPTSDVLLRRFYGSEEFIKGYERWCLWITDELLDQAKEIRSVRERIEKVYQFRVASKAKTTNAYSTIPHKFAQRCAKETHAIIIPSTSSERREYIPIGFLESGSVISNSANALYDVEPYIFGLISSKLHMLWIKTIGGRMDNRLRYSTFCYNTFPVISLSETQKDTISNHVFNILEEREKHPEKTISQLYDPEKMPTGLKKAHEGLDIAVEKQYRSRAFINDTERLEFLFAKYEEMTA